MNEALHIAIVGSGPAALYAAAELAKQRDPLVHVTMLDRLPCIGGLVRSGVAPDHHERRLMIDAYEKLARSAGRFEFIGPVEVGRDITHEELLAHHHGVIYAVGASGSQPLNIPGATLPGCYPSNEFVGWYNGHPDYSDLDVDLSCQRAVVIGNGNVALDIARLLLKSDEALTTTDIADHARIKLSKSNIKEVVVLGRRGPVQASFTHPELHELGGLVNVEVKVSPVDLDASEWPIKSFSMSMRRACLAGYTSAKKTAAEKTLELKFLASPVSLQGDSGVSSLTLIKNRLEQDNNGQVHAFATELTEEITTGLVVHAIGYKALPVPGLPFDETIGIVPNRKGRVANQTSGTYVTGWIKRGARGVIGTNKVCAAETVASLLEDVASDNYHRPRNSPQQFTELLRQRIPDFVDYRGWKMIDQHERSVVEEGAPRRKICSVEEMVGIANSQTC